MKQIYTPLFCCLFFAGCALSLSAQREAVDFNEAAYFDFNDKIKECYKSALRMRFKEAKVSIQSELARNPYNLMPHYVDDYIDFLRIFINESEIEYKNIKSKKEGRAAKLASGDDASPYYLYAQADLFLHWAMIELKFGDDTELLKDLKRAYMLIEENKKRFPNFIPNKKTSGLINMLASTLSGSVRNALSIKTSMKTGIEEIQSVIAHGQKNPTFEFNEETQVLYALMLMQLGSDNPTYWAQLNAGALDYKVSPMAAYVLASMYIRTGMSSKALIILEGYPKGEDYYDFHYLQYLMGLCKLYKLDAQAATYFSNFVGKHGGSHHIKDAYQKIAWSYLLRGDAKNYAYQMTQVLSHGDAVMESDAIAQEEATIKIAPSVSLLKVRLLFDGGYYENAYKEIATIQESALTSANDKLEYYYFYGRIYHKMKQYDNALKYYALATNAQKNSTHYFACNAALQMGILYDSRKETDKAKAAFGVCLKLTPTHYRALLHGQAQSYADVIK